MRNVVVLCVCSVPLALVGCGNRSPAEPKTIDPTQQRLMLLGQVYRQFNREKQRPPQSESDLALLLEQRGADKDPFYSARDGLKFVVCWGTNVLLPPTENRRRPVLAYEQSGAEGRRFVLSTMGNVEQLEDGPFRESLFPPGFEPAP